MRTASLILLLINFFAANGQSGIGMELFGGYHFAPNRIEKTGESMNRYCLGADIIVEKSNWIPETILNSHGAPNLGFRFRFAGIRPIDTFGYSFALMPQLEQPIFKWKKISAIMRVAYGINGNTKVYDFENNFDNRAISSYVNFGVDFAGGLAIQTGNQGLIRLFSGLYHVSNGSLKMSNGGINLVYVSMGYQLINKDRLAKYFATKATPIQTSEKYFAIQVLPFIANREIGYISNIKRFWITGLSSAGIKKINNWYALGIGADFFLDASPIIKTNDSIAVSEINLSDRFFYAVGLHQHYEIGKWFFPLGLYRYLNNKNEPYYIRFGLGYSAKSGITAGCFFKGTVNNTGKLNSDFMEWSLGYRFNFFRNQNNQEIEKH